MTDLAQLASTLRRSTAVRDKIEIREAYGPAVPTAKGTARLGDDCAVLDDVGPGRLLFAAEGLLTGFVRSDPWFAGYSAVMVNINDICAMGGVPLAVVDVLWTPTHDEARPVWEGMAAASAAYGVPIVGGHTTKTRRGDPVHLATAVVGRATNTISSFDAVPGDDLLMAVDLAGSYRGDQPFWNASTGASPGRLRELTGLWPLLAQHDWCRAAKDISNGGVIGTLIMMLECSGVGARLVVDDLPKPDDVDVLKWLLSFPSFGFLLSVPTTNRESVIHHFERAGVTCAVIGRVTEESALEVELAGDRERVWSAPVGVS